MVKTWRQILCVMMFLSLASVLQAARIIDDFEDGNISANPAWWKFGRIIADVVENTGKAPKGVKLGGKGMSLEGSTRDWYIGGLGTYLGVDGTAYANLELLVYGKGKNSGQLKIELWDDDNKNWKAEQDEKKNYVPIHDDQFATTLVVDWEGWKKVVIPFDDFSDENPGVGNDKWDPNQIDGSGGLLQLSMVALGRGAKGEIKVIIDDMRFTGPGGK